MSDITLSAVTGVENVAGSDSQVTRVSFTFPASPTHGRHAFTTPHGVWGRNSKPEADFLAGNASGGLVQVETNSSVIRPSGDLPTSENFGGFGTILRVRDDPDHIDSRMFCTVDDNPLTLTTSIGMLFAIDGDTDLDGWFWPVPSHLWIDGSRRWRFVTDAAPRAVYTQLKHALYPPRDADMTTGSALLPSGLRGAGNPRFPTLADGVVWDETRKWLFGHGKVFHYLGNANTFGSGQSTERSLVWGLPPTARGFWQTGSGTRHSTKTAQLDLIYTSAVTGQTSAETIYSQTVNDTGSGSFGFWSHINLGISLAGATIPDWADFVELDAGPSGQWGSGASDGWCAHAPHHFGLALPCHDGSYIPGIVREVVDA